jgi:hypothetical protein
MAYSKKLPDPVLDISHTLDCKLIRGCEYRGKHKVSIFGGDVLLLRHNSQAGSMHGGQSEPT